MWFACPGLKTFFLALIDLLLRRIPPERWVIMPNGSDYGKSLWVDFLGYMLTGADVNTFRGLWLESEKVLSTEGLSIINDLIAKIPELNNKISGDILKNLPQPSFRQMFRLCHGAKCPQISMAFMLRIIEVRGLEPVATKHHNNENDIRCRAICVVVDIRPPRASSGENDRTRTAPQKVNPDNDGYKLLNPRDDFLALVKRLLVLEKPEGCGYFPRDGTPTDPTRGIFPIDHKLRDRLLSPPCLRAMWRYFVEWANDQDTATLVKWVKDLRTFDAAHKTDVQTKTEQFVVKLGCLPKKKPSAEMPSNQRDRNGMGTGFRENWESFGLQPSLQGSAQKREYEKKIAASLWLVRKWWHKNHKKFTGAVRWFPNYFPLGVLGHVPNPYGKRGRLQYTETPCRHGLGFHIQYGCDKDDDEDEEEACRGFRKVKESESAAKYLASIDPATGTVDVTYRFYKALENRTEEGSRRCATIPAAQGIKQTTRGAAHGKRKKLLDIVNCDFVMLLHWVLLINFGSNPPDLKDLWEIVTDRDAFYDRLGVPRKEAKKMALVSAYDLYAQDGELEGLVKNLSLIAELIAQAYPGMHSFLEQRAEEKSRDKNAKKSATDPRATHISYVAADFSNAALSSMENVLMENGVHSEAAIFDACMFDAVHGDRVTALLPEISRRVHRDLGLAPTPLIQFRIEDVEPPPYWTTPLGQLLREKVGAPEGSALVKEEEGAQLSCAWQMLHMLGRTPNTLPANINRQDGASASDLMTAAGGDGFSLVVAEILQPGHDYAFLQDEVQGRPHWVGIDATEINRFRILDPLAAKEIECKTPEQRNAVCDFTASRAGTLFRFSTQTADRPDSKTLAQKPYTIKGFVLSDLESDADEFDDASASDDSDQENEKPSRKRKPLPAAFIEEQRKTVQKAIDYLNDKIGDPEKQFRRVANDKRYWCPFCPAHETGPEKRWMKRHLEEDHLAHVATGCTTSTKLKRMAVAFWYKAVDQKEANADLAELFNNQNPAPAGPAAPPPAIKELSSLEEAAQLIAKDVAQSPSWAAQKKTLQGHTNWDRHLRKVLADYPRYVLADDADTVGRHQISAEYWATDVFLMDFLGVFIDPDVRGARRTTLAKLRERVPRERRHLLPWNEALFATVARAVLRCPLSKTILRSARRACNRKVLAVDGTYKALLSVLYQIPFGKSKPADYEELPGEIHVIMTMAGVDGILGMCTALTEKRGRAQLLADVLPEEQDRDEVLLIFSDQPEEADSEELRDFFERPTTAEEVVQAADAKHVPIRAQACSGEKPTKMTAMLSRVMVRFRHPMAGPVKKSDIYRKSSSPPPPSSQSLLVSAYEKMTDAKTLKLIKEINAEDYTEKPIATGQEYAEAVAALCRKFEGELNRSNAKGRTLWAILQEACRPQFVEYLLNGPRALKLYQLEEEARRLYGTTSCEADAKETKGWFLNVHYIRAESAELRIEAKSLMKTVAARTSVTNPDNGDQRDRLRNGLGAYRDAVVGGVSMGPALNLRTEPYAKKPADLPENARVLKKRRRVLDSDEEDEMLPAKWGGVEASQTKSGGVMKMKK